MTENFPSTLPAIESDIAKERVNLEAIRDTFASRKQKLEEDCEDARQPHLLRITLLLRAGMEVFLAKDGYTGEEPWRRWASAKLDFLSSRYRRDLISIARQPDPKKALEIHRATIAARVQKHRQKKSAGGVTKPVTPSASPGQLSAAPPLPPLPALESAKPRPDPAIWAARAEPQSTRRSDAPSLEAAKAIVAALSQNDFSRFGDWFDECRRERAA